MEESNPKSEGIPQKEQQPETHRTIQLSGMYENWFLDYASYVILERAVPDIEDGLKPVQRRILHAMRHLDDGRFNKVANIIGHTMQYHPHGDASIGDALVQLGQKELLVETQGNWGNVLTGDSAAASRYIEARLSKFANEVVFNPKTTKWKLSYDGRNREPISLPMKFPILLAQGVEGIAVGLASKILPHNFNELIDASISHLKGKSFELVPDFLTGGLADCTKYNDGLRGGKVRIRARISQLDRKTLAITEIPFSTTTSTLIDSIVSANDKGKIKVRKIDDNTAEHVEIVIHLAAGVSPDQTIDALYAFTQCEVSISPNACVILDGKPAFIGVSEILRFNTERTMELLRMELQIRLDELENEWHFSSLEKIFIENRIYRDIEQCETWEAVIDAIGEGLKAHLHKLRREVTADDIVRLTEIKIKRISKFNSFKADDHIKSIEDEIDEVNNHLQHLVEYAINFFQQIKKKYGNGRERKTELRNFDVIQAAAVAANNERLYVNRAEGFAGTSLKKDEFVCECSDLDDIIVFRANGTFSVTKVTNKSFVGEDIIHIDVFRKNDDRTIYNMVYRDGRKGPWYVKRFAVVGVTRDKEYEITAGNTDSKVVYFTANPNGEAEIIKVQLRPRPRLKKTHFEYDFAQLAIKGRNSKGNILSKNPIKHISKREDGVSTLGAMEVWYDETVKRLNTDERGQYLGDFSGEDRILCIMNGGEMKLTGFELSTHFEDDLRMLRKFKPEEVISAVYFDGESKKHYLKRFTIDPDTSINKRFNILNEHVDTKMVLILFDEFPRLKLGFQPNKKGKKPEDETVLVADFVGVKSYKAKGKRLSAHEIDQIETLEPIKSGPSVADQIKEDEEPKIAVTASDPAKEEAKPDVTKDVSTQKNDTDESLQGDVNEQQVEPSPKRPDPPLQMELEF